MRARGALKVTVKNEGANEMSVIDSRRFRRRSTASFTREEFERIKNTPPPDREKMREESRRLV